MLLTGALMPFIPPTWPLVNTAYPLLEQSLKALVLVLDKAYNPYADQHSLKAVFCRLDGLDPKIADRIRKAYTAFQSLYDYINYRTLDEFINNIDNDYTKWRYFLLEGWKNGQPAKNSAEAMLEVSRQTLDVLAAHVATDHGFQTVGYRLEWKVTRMLTRQVNVNHQEELTDALNAWHRDNDGILNGIAKIVWCEDNENIPIPYQFQPLLADLMDNLMKALIEDQDRDVQQFLIRASHAPTSLVWDRKQGIFR